MNVMIKQSLYLMRLDKPIGILLLLWPTLWALWLAGRGSPDMKIVSIFVWGVVIMRSAGCVINDFADRALDGLVARTRSRPLATGQLRPSTALILFFILLMAAFLLVLLLNSLTIKLAFVGVALAIGYPFLKRITHLPQLGLGLAFSWGVPMAFAALNNTVSLKAWALFFVAALWPVIYDTMYAMTDRADDLKIGVKSTAILFGRFDIIIIACLQCLFVMLLAVLGWLFQLTYVYYLSIGCVAGLFIYQQILIKDRIPERCFQAFLHNHWVGMSLFIGILLNYENCCR